MLLDRFAILPRVLDGKTVERLRAAVDRVADGEAVRRRGGVYGIRNLLGVCPEVRALAGPDTFAVRGTVFKSSRPRT